MGESIFQLGLNPISSESPTGDSVRYEEEYEELQDEISKQESLKDEAVEWSRVVELSTKILSSMSKDLVVACYLCKGLYVTQEYQGLVTGLSIIRDMISTFWDELYPEKKRMRARISAVKWLIDRLALDIPNKKPSIDKHDAIITSIQLATELEQMLDKVLDEQKPSGEQVPSWSELQRALKDYNESLTQEKAKQEQAKSVSSQNAPLVEKGEKVEKSKTESVSNVQPRQTAPLEITEIGSDQDADRALRVCKETLKKIASYRRNRKLDDPQHYHLLRMAVWADIELPVTQNGRTQVRNPPDGKEAHLNGLLESGNFEELIHEVESSFSAAPFWLSLHRYVATALEALGYSDALATVINDLSLVLQRFPMLPDCKFVGGDTFADEMTSVWIQNTVLAGGASNEVATVSIGQLGGSEEAGWIEVGKEAKILAAQGEIKKAVNLLKEGRNLARTGRERFLWGVQEARFWQDAGHVEIAVPQLESLEVENARCNLEQWEPELSIQIAELLLVWYKRMEKKGSLSQERMARRESMRARVSRLDAVRAMDLFSKG